MKRVCSVCKIEKSLEEFYKSKIEKFGREYRCKICSSRKMKKYREKDPDAWRKRSEEWRKIKISQNPNFYREKYLQFKEQNKKYASRNKEKIRIKHRAHAQIYWDVKNRKIFKPLNCQNCHVESKRIEGHHEDYDKPKEVKWLCTKCHRMADKLRRRHEQCNLLSGICTNPSTSEFGSENDQCDH